MADSLLTVFKQRERYAAQQSRLNSQLQQEIAERLLTLETLKLIDFSLDRVGDAVFLSKQMADFVMSMKLLVISLATPVKNY
ncbi:hypothetical protein LYNGBM3L_22670 [Moorena producens 3L]|uniref:Uncharacterized protein n=2 Tax=Moorena TaxID=1155738 RepID=F4XNN9_9CYAN|nr:hypothetical protein [Moorena producens]EGJ33802.1 hypothetical protein LYNGBM3L_22670 [Moorena producens 3L]OLT68971.1 hypothetical protein BI334_31695 [Moorena producens 3L]